MKTYRKPILCGTVVLIAITSLYLTRDGATPKAVGVEIEVGNVVIVSPTGTDDARPTIQKALDAVESMGGGRVRLLDGRYIIGDGTDDPDQSLMIGDNVELAGDPNAILIRNRFGPDESQATVRNKTQSGAGNTNIRVTGMTFITEDPNMYGKHLGFIFAHDLIVSDVRILSVYDDWNTGFRDCTDVMIHNVYIDSGESDPETAGLQFAGGSNITITGCIIKCGDDCIALVNDDNQQETNMEHVVVSNCYLLSRIANALRLHVEEDITNTIRWVRVSNIVAKVGDDDENATCGGIHIINENTSKRISDVDIDSFLIDANENEGVEWLYIDGVERVRLAHVVCRRPWKRALIDNSNRVELVNCIIDTPRQDDPAQPCLLVASQGSCSNIRILGGQYTSAKEHGIQLGSASYSVVNGEVSHVSIQSAVNDGLLLWNSQKIAVIGNSIQSNGGWGIEETGASSHSNLFLGNHLLSNGTGALSLAGVANTEAIRNVDLAGFDVPDTGGFRETADGWVLNGIPNTLAATEMARFNVTAAGAGRFRAARPGSITGLVVTTTVAAPMGSALIVTAWKNTGAAGGGGATTGFTATLPAGQSRVAVTAPKDTYQFIAGDEIFIKIEVTGWGAMTGGNAIAAVETEK